MTPHTQKNPKIQKNFDRVFNHEGVPKIDFYFHFLYTVEKTEFSKYEIRFSITLFVLEIFGCKVILLIILVTEFLPIFRNFECNWPTRLNPIFSKRLSEV